MINEIEEEELLINYTEKLDNLIMHMLNNPLIQNKNAFDLINSFCNYHIKLYSTYKNPKMVIEDFVGCRLTLMHPDSIEMFRQLSKFKDTYIHAPHTKQADVVMAILNEMKKSLKE